MRLILFFRAARFDDVWRKRKKGRGGKSLNFRTGWWDGAKGEGEKKKEKGGGKKNQDLSFNTCSPTIGYRSTAVKKEEEGKRGGGGTKRWRRRMLFFKGEEC